MIVAHEGKGDKTTQDLAGKRISVVRGGTIAINNRLPIGTFPGSGRIGTAATVGGMVLAGRGRSRF